MGVFVNTRGFKDGSDFGIFFLVIFLLSQW